jgi:hypothetical protein
MYGGNRGRPKPGSHLGERHWGRGRCCGRGRQRYTELTLVRTDRDTTERRTQGGATDAASSDGGGSACVEARGRRARGQAIERCISLCTLMTFQSRFRFAPSCSTSGRSSSRSSQIASGGGFDTVSSRVSETSILRALRTYQIFKRLLTVQ